MNGYLTHILMNLRLTARNRMALVFTFMFPLIFFFMFGQLGDVVGTQATQITGMVLTLGAVGSGLFGVGLRAAMEREQNILRRFKVAPISPAPILISGMVTTICLYLPLAAVVVVMGNQMYGAPYPPTPFSLAIFLICGLLAFAAIGSIIAAVVNSMQESQILIQAIYFPMIFLGGVFPITLLPDWLQVVAQFIPTAYFMTGMQPILRGQESLADNLPAIAALLSTAVISGFLAVKLFRWEKDEKMKPAAKLWVLAVLGPFVLMGLWQMQDRGNIVKARVLERDLRRSGTWLIRDARLFLGDGAVIERGSVLIADGRIAEVYEGDPPADPRIGDARPIDGAGKTLLPGLIDVHTHLASTGVAAEEADTDPEATMGRALAAYLYSGVTAVKSVGDSAEFSLALRDEITRGERLAAELFATGPMFTVEGGHGTEFVEFLPEALTELVNQLILRLPETANQARADVDELAGMGVDGIKAILDAGAGSTTFHRMDPAMLEAIADAAHANDLPIVVHTGDVQDIADAVAAGADGVEHGTAREPLTAEVIAALVNREVAYDPTLSVIESLRAFVAGDPSPLERTLVQQVAPRELLTTAVEGVSAQSNRNARDAYAGYPFSLAIAQQNLLAAYQAGVLLSMGTDSGNPLLLHGPAIHRELQLWVAAGLPAEVALQAATFGNAQLLGAEDRLGLIRPGYEASLLLVDGNPLEDITSTERISSVFFKGERVNRTDLLAPR